MKINTKKQSNIVGLKELRQNMGHYITRVQRGDSYTIIRRAEPVFRISPPDEDDNWETVADFTKIQKEGVLADVILARLKGYGKKNR